MCYIDKSRFVQPLRQRVLVDELLDKAKDILGRSRCDALCWEVFPINIPKPFWDLGHCGRSCAGLFLCLQRVRLLLLEESHLVWIQRTSVEGRDRAFALVDPHRSPAFDFAQDNIGRSANALVWPHFEIGEAQCRVALHCGLGALWVLGVLPYACGGIVDCDVLGVERDD